MVSETLFSQSGIFFAKFADYFDFLKPNFCLRVQISKNDKITIHFLLKKPKKKPSQICTYSGFVKPSHEQINCLLLHYKIRPNLAIFIAKTEISKYLTYTKQYQLMITCVYLINEENSKINKDRVQK